MDNNHSRGQRFRHVQKRESIVERCVIAFSPRSFRKGEVEFEIIEVIPRPGKHFKPGTMRADSGFIKGKLEVSSGPRPYVKIVPPEEGRESLRLVPKEQYVAYCQMTHSGRVIFVAVVPKAEYDAFKGQHLPDPAVVEAVQAVPAVTEFIGSIPDGSVFADLLPPPPAFIVLPSSTDEQGSEQGAPPDEKDGSVGNGTSQVEKFRKHFGDAIPRRTKPPKLAQASTPQAAKTGKGGDKPRRPGGGLSAVLANLML